MRKPFVAMLAVLVLSGCKDECNWKTDLATCEGQTVVVCDEPGVDQVVPNKWRRRPCLSDQVCVEDAAGKTAFCALSAEKNANCAGERTAACESATAMTYCLNGWATSRFVCRECVPTDKAVDCRGGISTKCTATTECATGLACDSRGYCSSNSDR